MLTRAYRDIRAACDKVTGYLGMLFDFSTAGQVAVNAPGFVSEMLTTCRTPGSAVSPATENLFDISKDSVTEVACTVDREYFHSHVAKLLYLAKRCRPEILTAVSFLSTRVNVCNIYDLEKLHHI